MKITKENLVETLKYNGYERLDTTDELFYNKIKEITIGVDLFFNQIRTADSSFMNNNSYYIYNHDFICSNFDDFMAFINKKIDLNPLPDFDFVYYLVSHGWDRHSNNCLVKPIILDAKSFFYNNVEYAQTKENADKLLEVRIILRGLKQ